MADFYGTVDGLKSYLNARQIDVSAFDDDDISAALLVASEWIDAVYGSQFSGTKVGQRDQVREQPRNAQIDVYGYSVSSDSVPREVENATYQAAYRQLNSPGSLTLDYTPGKYKSVAIDGAINVQYATFNSAADIQTQFTIIDQIIAPLLTGDNGNFSNLSGYVARV